MQRIRKEFVSNIVSPNVCYVNGQSNMRFYPGHLNIMQFYAIMCILAILENSVMILLPV